MRQLQDETVRTSSGATGDAIAAARRKPRTCNLKLAANRLSELFARKPAPFDSTDLGNPRRPLERARLDAGAGWTSAPNRRSGTGTSIAGGWGGNNGRRGPLRLRMTIDSRIDRFA